MGDNCKVTFAALYRSLNSLSESYREKQPPGNDSNNLVLKQNCSGPAALHSNMKLQMTL